MLNAESRSGTIDRLSDSEHRQVLASMAGYVEQQLEWMRQPERAWQPSDFLPDSSSEQWIESVARVREAARALSDELLVVLVGNTITEEALPSYQTMLQRLEGIEDETGDSDAPWARWCRWWSAEENRHGDLLQRYLYLSGRVNLRAVEVTIQTLLRRGFNAHMEGDPYRGFVYTSFQEQATKISHGNVGRLARKAGDPLLDRICRVIASDESRHAEIYARFMDRIFELDPRGAVIAFYQIARKPISMPGRLMNHSGEEALFRKFSTAAERIGVYTIHDYASILEQLVQRWKVPSISGLRGEAAEAQEVVSDLVERYRRLAAIRAHRVPPANPADSRLASWLSGMVARF